MYLTTSATYDNNWYFISFSFQGGNRIREVYVSVICHKHALVIVSALIIFRDLFLITVVHVPALSSTAGTIKAQSMACNDKDLTVFFMKQTAGQEEDKYVCFSTPSLLIIWICHGHGFLMCNFKTFLRQIQQLLIVFVLLKSDSVCFQF